MESHAVRYKVTIPVKPTPKGRARVGKNGGTPWTPKQTIVAENWVRLKVNEAVGAPRVEGPVAVRAEFIVPVPRSWSRAKRTDALQGRLHPVGRPDLDNYCKLVCDALNGIAWLDDSAVVTMDLVKRYGSEPGTVLEWWTLPDDGLTHAQGSAQGGGLAAGLL